MRAVIADESMLSREGLARLLEDGGIEVVAQAKDGDDLLRRVMGHKPDVVITGLDMDAALAVRERYRETPVLVLADRLDVENALAFVDDGSDGRGYMLKHRIDELDHLIKSVERVAEGGSALDAEVVSRLLASRHGDGPLDALTPREHDVLARMAEGCANHEIALKLGITDRSVEKYVTSIFDKLDLGREAAGHRRVRAVLTFLGPNTTRG